VRIDQENVLARAVGHPADLRDDRDPAVDVDQVEDLPRERAADDRVVTKTRAGRQPAVGR
jgi:hypothetical protein